VKWYTADEVDVRALPLQDVTLSYPEALSTVRMPGRVRIALFIDENGWVVKTQVVESEPARVFDEAAIRAWREVRFSPALKSQQPVKSEKLLDITFTPY